MLTFCPENYLILKVLNELQSSYDELLHKYAAAENALDKVSGFNQAHHYFDKVFAQRDIS